MTPGSKTWSLVLGRLVASSRNEFSAAQQSLEASSIARRCFVASSPHSTSTSTSSPPPPQSQVVGFVGLGAMGSRIAVNLSRAFPLVACDSSRAAVDAFIAAAEKRDENLPRHALASALSVPELFKKAAELHEKGEARRTPAAILTSLPSPAAVRDVWLGERGLIRRAAIAAAASAAAAASGSKGASEEQGSVALVEL